MARDLFNDIKISKVIVPAAAITDNTAQVGAIIDNQNFDSLVYAWTLVTPDADATLTPLLEEGDNASLTDKTAVADADLLGTEAGATDSAGNTTTYVWKLGYKGTKRYTRLTLTPAANTGNLFLSCVAIQGGARSLPQSTQNI